MDLSKEDKKIRQEKNDIQTFLTHCRLNRLSHAIYWKSQISILGTSGYDIYIFLEKMVRLFANSSAASDLGLHCLPITRLWVSRLNWVKHMEDKLFRYLSYVLGRLNTMYFFYRIASCLGRIGQNSHTCSNRTKL